jgi:hypothetical protein
MRIVERLYLIGYIHNKTITREELAIDAASIPSEALALAFSVLKGETEISGDELVKRLGPKYGPRILSGLLRLNK